MDISPLHPKLKRAFTLVELLVVLVVVGILAALLLAAVSRMTGMSDAVKCASNLRQIHIACLNFAIDKDGYLPAVEAKTNFPGSQVNWWTEIRPYIPIPSGQDMYKNPAVLQCPGYGQLMGAINLKYKTYPNFGMNAALGYCSSPVVSRRLKLSGIPQPSLTIMVTEGGHSDSGTVATLNPTYLMNGARFNGQYIGGTHSGANNILWCDGHVSAWRDVDLLTKNNDFNAGPSSKYWTPGFSMY